MIYTLRVMICSLRLMIYSLRLMVWADNAIKNALRNILLRDDKITAVPPCLSVENKIVFHKNKPFTASYRVTLHSYFLLFTSISDRSNSITVRSRILLFSPADARFEIVCNSRFSENKLRSETDHCFPDSSHQPLPLLKFHNNRNSVTVFNHIIISP